MWTREKLLHPATAIALVALFVSLGGVTYAAATIGTNQIKNAAVTNAKLRNGAVSGAKIRKGAISANRIARGAVRGDRIARDGVTARELRAGAVATGKLADGAVSAPKLAVGSVTTAKLADNSVGGAKLGNGQVGTAKLADRGVTNGKLADGAVTAAKLAPGAAVAGSGQLLTTRVQLGNGQVGAPLLTLPGIGRLQATCTAGSAAVSLASTAAAALDVQVTWTDQVRATDPAQSTRVTRQPVAPNSLVAVSNNGVGGVQSATWQIASTAPAPAVPGAAPPVATAWVSSGAAGQNCVVTVQALAS